MPDPTIGLLAVSAGSSIIGANKNSRAVNRATDAQVDAADAGIAEQRRQFDAIQELLSPYVQGGNAAFSEMMALAGLAPPAAATPTVAASKMTADGVSPKMQSFFGSDVQIQPDGTIVDPTQPPGPVYTQQAAMDRVANDPRLAYQMQQAEEALLANSAATGGVRGGNTAGVLSELRPALYSQAIDRRYAELGGLAGMGQASATNQAAMGQTFANNASNLYGQIGAAQAGGAMGSAAAFNQGLRGVSNAFGVFSAEPQAADLYAKWGF